MEENLKINENDDDIDDLKQLPTLENDKHKKSLITFSRLNKYFLIPFITPVFLTISSIFFAFLEKSMKSPLFVSTIYEQLAIFSSGFLYFFSSVNKIFKKRENKIVKEESNNSLQYIYNKNEPDINQKKLDSFIVILALLMTIYEVFEADGIYPNSNYLEKELYFFILTPLFCKFIIKENIYKHHYVSLTIGIIGIIIVSIPVCFKFSKDDILPNIVNFIVSLAYSLFYVLIKYVIKEFYMSIFKICLIVCILSLIFELFGFTIFSLIKYHNFSFFKDIFEFSNAESIGLIIISFIFAFVFTAISQVLLFLVILYFSPLILITTIIINPFLYWIYDTIENGESRLNIILSIIGYIIVVFASLIYNEIIIFNFLGLSDNTKKFIEQRLFDDTSDLKRLETELKLGDLNNSIDNESGNLDD